VSLLRRHAIVLALGSGLAGMASCGPRQEGYQTSYQGTAAQAAAGVVGLVRTSALLAAAVDGVPPEPRDATGEIAATAAAAAAAAGRYYSPAGCVTATSMKYNGFLASYSFSDCAGLFGVTHLTGMLTATFVEMMPGLSMRLEGVVAAQATGSDRSFLIVSPATSVSWDQALNCLGLDSSPSNPTQASVKGFHQCGAACPTSGTASKMDPDTTGTVTLTYDGTNKPRWSTSDGYSGTVALACP
jgi:hypothetical protein